MLCEVEFLAVGDGSRPGDAIIVRYGDPAAYQLVVVDGGTANCGETLVVHLKKHFGALVSLEHVVLTRAAAEAVDGQAFFGRASEVADEVDDISFCDWTPSLGERRYAIVVEWL